MICAATSWPNFILIFSSQFLLTFGRSLNWRGGTFSSLLARSAVSSRDSFWSLHLNFSTSSSSNRCYSSNVNSSDSASSLASCYAFTISAPVISSSAFLALFFLLLCFYFFFLIFFTSSSAKSSSKPSYLSSKLSNEMPVRTCTY